MTTYLAYAAVLTALALLLTIGPPLLWQLYERTTNPVTAFHPQPTTQNPELRHGILRAWDSVGYLATVQLSGSQAQHVANIPVARDIASAEMTLGRKVAVAFFDPSNVSDACLIAVWT